MVNVQKSICCDSTPSLLPNTPHLALALFQQMSRFRNTVIFITLQLMQRISSTFFGRCILREQMEMFGLIQFRYPNIPHRMRILVDWPLFDRSRAHSSAMSATPIVCASLHPAFVLCFANWCLNHGYMCQSGLSFSNRLWNSYSATKAKWNAMKFMCVNHSHTSNEICSPFFRY